ncbi:CHAT domain-containing protein [Streptomyces sp. NPDC048483]|uniref:CHAT domain-containing protein n=1 Tax=Streptomyces sp. NPDC048483 TaxID=3154927 RepID=UPI00342220E6
MDGGGLMGVRAWAREVMGRADVVIPFLRDAPTGHTGTDTDIDTDSVGTFDRLTSELAELQTLLGPEESLWAPVTLRLGALYGFRHLHRREEAGALDPGGAQDRDRSLALRHLRGAREAGGALGEREAQCAAMFLLMLTVPAGLSLPEAGFAGLMDWQLRDKAGISPSDFDVRELHELLTSVQGMPLPPELRQFTESMLPVFALLAADAASEEASPGTGALDVDALLNAVPATFPFRDQLRALADLSGLSGVSNGGNDSATAASPPPDGTPPADTSPPADASPPADMARQTAQMLAFLEQHAPGSLSAEQLRRQTEELDRPLDPQQNTPSSLAQDALLSVGLKVREAFLNGDPDQVNAALGRLLPTLDQLPEDDEMSRLLRLTLAGVMQSSQAAGGTIQDFDLADRLTELAKQQLAESPIAPDNPHARLAATHYAVMAAVTRASRAVQEEDLGALDACLEELERLRAAAPESGEVAIVVTMALGQAYLDRGMLRNDDTDRRRGAEYLHAAATAEEIPGYAAPVMSALTTTARALHASYTSDPEELRAALDQEAPPEEPTESTPSLNWQTRVRWSTAMGWCLLFDRSKDRADLERAITEVEWIRRRITEGYGTSLAGDALWKLADLYWSRWHRSEDVADLRASTDAALASLRSRSADVLLQLGVEHGLLAARAAADHGLTAAWRAAVNGQVEEAVATLEVGRSLVLQAASTGADIPALLEEHGHPELAASWRQSAPVDASTTDEVGPELPSTLRRRALEALGYRQHGAHRQLFTTPTVDELRAGVADADADALVYLLPGRGEDPGAAVVLGPDVGTGVLALPEMTGAAVRPLETYLDAAAARSQLPPDAGADEREVAERAWEDALSGLCDWAWKAAMGPVLYGVAERLAANPDRRTDRPGPPRIVLVPCGNLGVVPWHAARLPEGARQRYLCQIMVTTYAASGGQFLRTLGRERMPAGSAAVLVADPRMDLTRAEQEVTALHQGCYPEARLYGEFYEPPVEPRGLGTPDELLALFSDAPDRERVSLLHVASHGSAGTRPTVSALHLGFPDETESLPPENGGPGATPDLGMLTVTRLLDRQPGGGAADRSGPLVVLSACETDLSTRDHDEAMTLTTAFLARGARDVVGSRWTTDDGGSALMMAVFHHAMAAGGLTPADALRAAQLWMLDPDRKAPPTLTGELLRDKDRPGLDRPAVWAAFIHQGHPGGRR